MVITGLPAKIPGLAACAACVAAKSAHLPHKEGCEQVDKQLQCIQIDMAGSMPVILAGGNECEHVVMGDYNWALYSRSLHLESEGMCSELSSCSRK